MGGEQHDETTTASASDAPPLGTPMRDLGVLAVDAGFDDRLIADILDVRPAVIAEWRAGSAINPRHARMLREWADLVTCLPAECPPSALRDALDHPAGNSIPLRYLAADYGWGYFLALLRGHLPVDVADLDLSWEVPVRGITRGDRARRSKASHIPSFHSGFIAPEEE